MQILNFYTYLVQKMTAVATCSFLKILVTLLSLIELSRSAFIGVPKFKRNGCRGSLNVLKVIKKTVSLLYLSDIFYFSGV